MHKILVYTLPLAVLAACGTNDQKPNTTTPPAKPAVDYGYFQDAGDSLLIPAFDIVLEVSPRAEEKLKKDKETVIIDATFSAPPVDETKSYDDGSGMMMVAGSKQELTTGRSAHFEGIKIAKKDWEGLKDKDVELLINVYSGRRASEDNILNTDIVSDKMSVVKGRTYTLKCKLIEEN